MIALKDERGFYYGGMVEGKPVRYSVMRKETKMDDALADIVVRQLRELGYGEWIKVYVS